MKKIIVETKLFESFSSLTKKILSAIVSGKVKKISAPDNKGGRDLANAVKNLKQASHELDMILDDNPELAEKFADAFKF